MKWQSHKGQSGLHSRVVLPTESFLNQRKTRAVSMRPFLYHASRQLEPVAPPHHHRRVARIHQPCKITELSSVAMPESPPPLSAHLKSWGEMSTSTSQLVPQPLLPCPLLPHPHCHWGQSNINRASSHLLILLFNCSRTFFVLNVIIMLCPALLNVNSCKPHCILHLYHGCI